jgi:hypothetical protein
MLANCKSIFDISRSHFHFILSNESSAWTRRSTFSFSRTLETMMGDGGAARIDGEQPMVRDGG